MTHLCTVDKAVHEHVLQKLVSLSDYSLISLISS